MSYIETVSHRFLRLDSKNIEVDMNVYMNMLLIVISCSQKQFFVMQIENHES